MGMTIEEIIKTFDYIKQVGNGESTYEHCRQEIALDEAVAIMHKYQKIKEIMSQEQTQWGVIKNTWLYKEIREVIENGNDNN